MMLLLLTGSIIFFFYSQNMQLYSFYDNFHSSGVENTAGCKIFFNNDESNHPDKDSRYYPDAFDCQGFSHAYITQWSLHKRSSAMLCNRQQGKILNCKTYYYSSHSS